MLRGTAIIREPANEPCLHHLRQHHIAQQHGCKQQPVQLRKWTNPSVLAPAAKREPRTRRDDDQGCDDQMYITGV